jgi:hypothetical protein
MKRRLGDLSSADLGVQITAQSLPPAHGVPRMQAPTTGYLESVHHFRVEGESYTAAIVRVHRTAAQVARKEPDHREIRGLCNDECEVKDA